VINGNAGALIQRFNPAGAIDFVLSIAVIALFVVVYFLPSIIGKRRDMLYIHMLFTTNLLFGWTIIAWILCVLWGLSGQTVAARMAVLGNLAKPQSR
jgi:hypothetical protein